MSKTLYYTATTVDGWIADPDNSLDWLFVVERGDDGEERWSSFFGEVGAMCMGATTYEWVYQHERLDEGPERWRTFYGDTPCWVFTHRRLPPIEGLDIRFVEGDVAPVHTAMVEAAAGKNVWVVGGGDLAGAFADAGLLDELVLNVAPVLLGTGAPLLPRRITAERLRLVSVDTDGQMAVLRYALS